MNACLQFRSIEKSYGRVTALAGVDLDIEEGSVVALLGPNGAGKSTLFGCLLGLTHATAGEVRWRGNPVTTANRLRFGYTPERVALYPHRSVWENGVFFARLRGHHPAEFEAQLTRMGLENFRERRICQLSKGMLQRLSLAIALCGKPELLVLDEPFNGLDPLLLDDLRQVLRKEHERGATLFISTHTISAIEPLATHVAILLNGRLVAYDALETLRRESPEAGSLEAIYQQVASRRYTVVEREQEEVLV